MKVERIDVLSFMLTEIERLDPVRVMIENYEPGKGRITITCYAATRFVKTLKLCS
ncbi:hypothetical protein [Citrobacter freundii]|uniref:hypothetical protein n=1 Tax=Citrobacter freundii TaxID=546 RepID=UPI001FF6251B|nr:hypothetical protein [Citrobacter freundii]EJT4818440.1 hypothetical protein [Citrobacter freundii]MCJ8531641.1 hypothetical protein [Citrobacter freundii]